MHALAQPSASADRVGERSVDFGWRPSDYTGIVKQKIDEVHRLLADTFRAPPEYEAAFSAFTAQAEEAQRQIDAFVAPFQREWEEHQRHARQLADTMADQMSREARESFPTLAAHGWFPDFHMYESDERAVARRLKEGQISAANRWLVQWYERRLVAIRCEITLIHPDRKQAISSACWAHQRRRYYLSIPVFLAQADGICSDVLGASPFSRRQGRPSTAPIIDQAGSFWGAMLSPLALALPLTASDKERGDISTNGLNRHRIVHGKSNDYGTRLNSAKSLSLLNFVVLALKSYKTADPRANLV